MEDITFQEFNSLPIEQKFSLLDSYGLYIFSNPPLGKGKSPQIVFLLHNFWVIKHFDSSAYGRWKIEAIENIPVQIIISAGESYIDNPDFDFLRLIPKGKILFLLPVICFTGLLYYFFQNTYIEALFFLSSAIFFLPILVDTWLFVIRPFLIHMLEILRMLIFMIQSILGK